MHIQLLVEMDLNLLFDLRSNGDWSIDRLNCSKFRENKRHMVKSDPLLSRKNAYPKLFSDRLSNAEWLIEQSPNQITMTLLFKTEGLTTSQCI